MDERRSHHNVSYVTHSHVVWCPNYRRKVLVNGIDTRLKQIVQDVCQEHDAILEEMEVMPDHIHLLVSVDPHDSIHRLVRVLKGRSSRILRQEYPRLKTRLPTLWTNSSFVATVGGAPLEIVKQYIEGHKRGEEGFQVQNIPHQRAGTNVVLDAFSLPGTVQRWPR